MKKKVQIVDRNVLRTKLFSEGTYHIYYASSSPANCHLSSLNRMAITYSDCPNHTRGFNRATVASMTIFYTLFSNYLEVD